MDFSNVEERILGTGLITRGAFHPDQIDGVPGLTANQVARTLILVGNAGPSMWDRFSKTCDTGSASLDEWSRQVLDRIADDLGAVALYPFTKPHLPFQRWAQKADACHASPLGIFIHSEFGLWHAYRGALAFSEIIALPDRLKRQSPCETCCDKPCLSTCPVGAFTETGYDVAACTAHVASDNGKDCRILGCRARRACPVGRDFTYQPAQAAFHMAAFLRTNS